MATEFDLVEACIKSYPMGPTTRSVREWVFGEPGGVAPMLLRSIRQTHLQGSDSRVLETLHDFAGRTWTAANDGQSPVQRLWKKLDQVRGQLALVNGPAVATTCHRQRVQAAREDEAAWDRARPGEIYRPARGSIEPSADDCVCDGGVWYTWKQAIGEASVTAKALMDVILDRRPFLFGDFLASEIADRLKHVTGIVLLAADAAGMADPGLRDLLDEATDSCWGPPDEFDGRRYSWILLQICWMGTESASVRQALLPAGMSSLGGKLTFTVPKLDPQTGEPAVAVQKALAWLLGKLDAAEPLSSDLKADTAAAAGELSPTVDGKTPGHRAGPAPRVARAPSEMERQIAAFYAESPSAMTQGEVAEQLNEKMSNELARASNKGKPLFPLTQQKVSRIIRRENRYRKANKIPAIPTRKKANESSGAFAPSVDPDVIEMGARTDHTAGPPREKSSDDR